MLRQLPQPLPEALGIVVALQLARGLLEAFRLRVRLWDFFATGQPSC